MNNSTVPVRVSSMGGRDYFIEEKAPKGSGTRCLVDCPKEIRERCIYDVQNMYLDNCQIPQYPWQCTGKNWQDVTEEEKIDIENGIVDAHFGGDRGLVRDFCDMMDGKGASLSRTTIDDSINSHLVCYSADSSMEKGVFENI